MITLLVILTALAGASAILNLVLPILAAERRRRRSVRSRMAQLITRGAIARERSDAR
ncbi:hypothetical protein [Nocardioides sp. zg-DK7169]|uniref:hypothetical protein n=1 Tax=Nocardioides sp. zg-DK7169 TaxID=2736600 RepID=UPI0015528146|nr:hypothetical protein [Nocardioides sp. zg-DK7169]NPC96812.1 hypothetical protein [Nocardioides sp. zg-DK7169]